MGIFDLHQKYVFVPKIPKQPILGQRVTISMLINYFDSYVSMYVKLWLQKRYISYILYS